MSKNPSKIPKKKITKKNKIDALCGVDEKLFLEAIENITKKLAYKFKFGYHEIDDMKQQIMLFALEGIKNYDPTRPLENFLWTHVRNRLFNYKRDNYQRPSQPCLTCPLYDALLKNSTSGCNKYSDKNECDLYSGWVKRNLVKKNLIHFSPIEEIKDYGNVLSQTATGSGEDMASKEIIDLIENSLSGELREIYLKLKHGCKVKKTDKDKLSEFLKKTISYG